MTRRMYFMVYYNPSQLGQMTVPGISGTQGTTAYPFPGQTGGMGIPSIPSGATIGGTGVQGTAGQGMQGAAAGTGSGMGTGGGPGIGGGPGGFEESYIENILRLNLGKVATVYMTFENNNQWNAKVFRGVVEAAGRDHIILSDPKTGMRYLLLMVYLDFVTFDEPLNYQYPFSGGAGR